MPTAEPCCTSPVDFSKMDWPKDLGRPSGTLRAEKAWRWCGETAFLMRGSALAANWGKLQAVVHPWFVGGRSPKPHDRMVVRVRVPPSAVTFLARPDHTVAEPGLRQECRCDPARLKR